MRDGMDPAWLSTDLLRRAYCEGAFPMTLDDGSIGWFAPHQRALFPIEGIRVSRSLARTLRRGDFEVTFDACFEETMRSCMRPDDNWISEPLIEVFTEAHREGWAHSCEVWRSGRLVGGIYGVALGSCFSAESMFHRETDMSKVALHAMVERCRGLGFRIFDAQIMNPHLRSLGAYEIPQRAYLARLQDCLSETTRPFA